MEGDGAMAKNHGGATVGVRRHVLYNRTTRLLGVAQAGRRVITREEHIF